MQKRAAGNRHSETAFVVPRADGDFDLRVFTPEVEDDLCGRATLGSDFVRVTAPSQGGVDYVSRFFPPSIGIDEDPATGSIHCTLAPYWAGRLGKQTLRAQQLSARDGDFRC